jgi:ribosomal protein L40E
MKCPKCHIENPDDNKFCRECGTALLSVCSKCRSEIQTGDKFCGTCGQKLLTEKEIKKPEPTTKGERKHVTVLFSDLSGYTVMSEKLDPEEVKESQAAFLMVSGTLPRDRCWGGERARRV